ncbi:acyloxyacyl hydrolase [Parasulfuritortus cantonensis]|uniref:Acyloxyacyl hydrolase n=1 Tax=Parasulfuritortus cantonensis TaxID=2528202 RepID=A0A4R1B2L1_9PROT|nr:acyloxyacyl hydrolase [Parasulfuritortus cantonensis]TCJ12284.1 acyloxyacyl hydrolase [Parasulfuritortus cantonensis]
MRHSAIAFLFAGLAAAATPAGAVDGYVVAVGGADDTQSLRVGMIRQWNDQWFNEGHWHMTGYWEGTLGYLNSDGHNGKSAADASFAPVFRLRPNAMGGAQPYWDLALSLHLLSTRKLDDRHDLGSALQVAPLVGLGVTFGGKSQYDLGYRFQHLTNLGLKEPDDGLNLHQVRLTYLY